MLRSRPFHVLCERKCGLSGNRIFTRAFTLDALACFCVNLAYYLTMVVVADFASSALGVSMAQAGLASGIFIVGALVARLAIGESVERRGPKKVLVVGIGIFLCSSVANVLLGSYLALVGLRLAQGFGFGLASTATGTIVAHVLPKQSVGEGMGYYSMSVTLASAVGPYIGIIAYGGGDLRGNLLLGVGLLAVGALCAAGLRVPRDEGGTNRRVDRDALPGSAPRKRRVVEPTAVPMAAVTFLVCLGFGGLLSYENVYVSSIGLGHVGGLFFVVYAMVTVLSRPFTGRLFDRRGDNFVLVPTFVLFAAGLALLGIASNGAMVIASAALVGLGYGTYMSCAQAVVIKLAPKQRIGLATSTFFIFMDIAVGFGPIVLGLVSSRWGFGALFVVLAAVSLAAGVLYFAVHGRNVRRADA